MSKKSAQARHLPIMNIIGEWNPQLWRELNSRLTWRNMMATVALSIGIQLMILMWIYRHHRLQEILWPDIAKGLSNWMSILICVVGVYFVASNFRQEDQRGTLDHLRLTPQKARSILIGKILGVPILVYLAGACALPLQFYAVHQTQASAVNVWIWDLAMVGLAVMFYLAAILFTLWLQAIPILLTVITWGLANLAVPASLRWQGEYGNNTLQWFGLQLSDRPTTFLLLIAMTGLAIYWLFQALERRYHQPTATVLSRKQSYWWSFSYHLLLLGFVTSYAYHPGTNQLAQQLSFNLSGHIYVGNDGDFGILPIICLNLIAAWFLLIIPVILPSTQSLIEWSQQGLVHQTWCQSRLWDNRSPATLAVLVNVAIASAIWSIPVLSLIQTSSSWVFDSWWPFVVQVFMIGAMMALASTVIHLGLFWRVHHPRWWKAGILSIQFLAMLIAGLSYADPNTLQVALIITKFFWSIILFANPAFFVMFFGLWMVMTICLQYTLNDAVSYSKSAQY
jgi:hypothetical protein